MKSCEICRLAPRTYCESDQASLCWDCDAKVHGANFLVARHVRCLLCHTCQSRTQWRAAGAKLGHTVSVCESCVNSCEREEREDENDDDDDEEEESYSNDDVSVDVDVEDGDNWSTISNTPPPASSSSSSEDPCGGERDFYKSTNWFSLKRLRENALHVRSQDDLDRLSPKRRYGCRTVLASRCRPEEEAVSVDSTRLWKDQQINPEGPVQLQSDQRDAHSTEPLGKN